MSDQKQSTLGKKLLADILVVFVMLLTVGLIALPFQFYVQPALGQKDTVGIFVFLVLAPSVIGGAYLGKYIVKKFINH